MATNSPWSCLEEFRSPSWFFMQIGNILSINPKQSTKSLFNLNQRKCGLKHILSAGFFVHQNPILERWQTRLYHIHRIISRSIILNTVKNAHVWKQLHANMRLWSILIIKKAREVGDSFSFKIIRLAKPCTKHPIPAFNNQVTSIYQQKFRHKQKSSLKIN